MMVQYVKNTFKQQQTAPVLQIFTVPASLLALSDHPDSLSTLHHCSQL